MGIWVVSNCFDTISDVVCNFVYISFCTCANLSVEEIPRSGISGLLGKNIKHLGTYSKKVVWFSILTDYGSICFPTPI